MLCKKCILPDSKHDIYLEKNGICNICNAYENKQSKDNISQKQFLEIQLVKQLEKYKNKIKGKYNCMVLCSGGKDSTMSLYYIKKRYKLNPLVFTFDHGFENEQAVKNIKNATTILGVDWVYYKSDYMNDIFSDIIKNKPKVSICHVCTLWYIQLSFDMALRFGIPIVVGGWTKGQSLEKGETGKEYEKISSVTRDYITNCLYKKKKHKNFPRNLKEAIKKFKGIVISPHWYIPWDTDKVMQILEHELNWRPTKLSYPKGSTNCLLNYASVYLSMKNFGYTHYHIEMSKLIRKGEITREEALKRLDIDFDKEFINKIINKIGCKID